MLITSKRNKLFFEITNFKRFLVTPISITLQNNFNRYILIFFVPKFLSKYFPEFHLFLNFNCFQFYVNITFFETLIFGYHIFLFKKSVNDNWQIEKND